MQIPILYLIDYLLAFAGTERHLYDLLMHLDRNRFKPHVITFKGSPDFVQSLIDAGIPVRILNISRVYGFRQLFLLFALRRFIKDSGIRIVQTFHTNADLFGTVLAKLSGVPIIISSRRDMGIYRNRRNVLAYRALNRYVDRIICVSERVKRFVMEDEGVEEKRMEVIYNGIDTEKFKRRIDVAAEKRTAGLRKRGPVVGMLANFNPVKGHRYFLEAAAEIRKTFPEVQFVFAGLGPLSDEMRHRARELGLDEAVRFLGHRPRSEHVLAVIDILVAPSLSEGFSNAILEALYMRKPVVATAVGGNPEVIEHYRTGILIPPADVDAIRRSVVELLGNPSLARRLGENGRKLVERKFVLPKMLERTADLYERLIRERGIGSVPEPAVAPLPGEKTLS